MADGGGLTRPVQKGSEVDFVAILDHDELDFFVRNGAADGALADAKEFGGFRYGQSDFGGFHKYFR